MNFFPFTRIVTGESIETAEDATFYDPEFLHGELEVARAKNVTMYIAQKIKAQTKKAQKPPNKKRMGLLIITNFRLCFVALEESHKGYKRSPPYQENAFLSKYDITLSNMDEIYAYTDKKHKLVIPQNKNASKIDAIRILCKNFRMITFDFSENCEVGRGKYIADALLQFAFPTRHNLLFMYHFREQYYNASRSIRSFNEENDWTQELQRCGISSQNGAWRVLTRQSPESDALPRCFVVPRHLSDEKYFDLCRSFRCKRAAVWVWSLENASLLRMADLLPELLNNPKEVMHSNDNLMLEHIRMCANLKCPPHCVELSKGLPSIQDVQQSYLRLRALCSPASDRDLTTQDEKFLSHVEKTCWLLYVSLCIKTANECAKNLQNGESVVLQEFEGRDMSCVISSLIQVILDPTSRTIHGFQVLIQKEWVALGHPFCDRMGHVYNKHAERSPLFLLFLDCVWQVLQQFPDAFEYSEIFLTTLWDTVFIPIFDTFQFNSEADRLQAVKEEKLVLRPVWDWGEMFYEKDVAMFVNPLYKKPQMSEQEIENNRKSRLPPSALKLPGMDILPKNPKQRFSLQPGKVVDTETHLLRPSQVLSHTAESPPKKLETMKPSTSSASAPSTDKSKYLKPSHHLMDLEIFSQCYFRFMPLLEIAQGGSVQSDLCNRVILNKIYKYQKAIETDNFTDLPPEEPEQPVEIDEYDLNSSGVAPSYKQRVPVVNSFFPFSYYDDGGLDNTNLNEILLYNSMSEGSVLDIDM
ncbi:myotubularin-related protein 10-B isoform X2 [Chironomus tepperi]|uniref:myotubularin-related protein 10-B isoform X2 n=1 Tax=Chironomus tepperi TaxID=113505 RepID=UPI00391F9CB7